MAYAEPADVSARMLRALSTAETALAETLLEDAERKIRRRIPDLDDQVEDVDTGEAFLADVIAVEANVVKRVIANPSGATYMTAGPFAQSLNPKVGSGVVEILPEDWADLGIAGGAFTITPHLDPPTTTYPSPFVVDSWT